LQVRPDEALDIRIAQEWPRCPLLHGKRGCAGRDPLFEHRHVLPPASANENFARGDGNDMPGRSLSRRFYHALFFFSSAGPFCKPGSIRPDPPGGT
jgi:hypothetical protein